MPLKRHFKYGASFDLIEVINMMLEKAKKALRIVTDFFDDEITDLIESAKLDLGISGVVLPEELDELCERAIITYIKCHFGLPEDYDRLKKSYDEQKAQLMTATGYTEWVSDDV